MIGKVKALTLALVVVCAFGVVEASGASAAEFHIAGMGSVTGDGTQIIGSPVEFAIPEGPLKCSAALYKLTTLTNSSNVDQETAGQTATVKVEEGGTETLACTFAGLAGSIVHMNGCDLRIHSGPPIQATVLCPAGKQIAVTAIVAGVTKCTINIPEQANLQGFAITNNASDLDLTSVVTSIAYQTIIGTGIGHCTETTAATEGQFKGKVTVQGTAGGIASTISYGESPPPATEFRVAGMGVATGDGTQVSGSPTEFSIPEGALKCPSAIFQVSNLTNSKNENVETAGQTATVNIQEGGTQTLACTFAGLAGSIVHMNGCDIRLHSGPPIQATVLCPSGKQIQVTAIVSGVTKCTIDIPTQADKQVLTIANNASDLDLTSAVTGLIYQTAAGTGAGACTETVPGTEGQFKGKVTVQGTAGGVASNISYS